MISQGDDLDSLRAVLTHAVSVTKTEANEAYEHNNCRWCGRGGYVNHPKIGTDFRHSEKCPVPALATALERLEAAELRVEFLEGMARRLSRWAHEWYGLRGKLVSGGAEEDEQLLGIVRALDAALAHSGKEG